MPLKVKKPPHMCGFDEACSLLHVRDSTLHELWNSIKMQVSEQQYALHNSIKMWAGTAYKYAPSSKFQITWHGSRMILFVDKKVVENEIQQLLYSYLPVKTSKEYEDPATHVKTKQFYHVNANDKAEKDVSTEDVLAIHGRSRGYHGRIHTDMLDLFEEYSIAKELKKAKLPVLKMDGISFSEQEFGYKRTREKNKTGQSVSARFCIDRDLYIKILTQREQEKAGAMNSIRASDNIETRPQQETAANYVSLKDFGNNTINGVSAAYLNRLAVEEIIPQLKKAQKHGYKFTDEKVPLIRVAGALIPLDTFTAAHGFTKRPVLLINNHAEGTLLSCPEIFLKKEHTAGRVCGTTQIGERYMKLIKKADTRLGICWESIDKKMADIERQKDEHTKTQNTEFNNAFEKGLVYDDTELAIPPHASINGQDIDPRHVCIFTLKSAPACYIHKASLPRLIGPFDVLTETALERTRSTKMQDGQRFYHCMSALRCFKGLAEKNEIACEVFQNKALQIISKIGHALDKGSLERYAAEGINENNTKRLQFTDRVREDAKQTKPLYLTKEAIGAVIKMTVAELAKTHKHLRYRRTDFVVGKTMEQILGKAA